MKDAEGEENHAGGDKTKDAADADDQTEGEKGKEAALDVGAVKESDQKTENKADEMSIDEPQVHEVEGDALPQVKEGQTDKNEPEIEEKQDNCELLQEAPMPAEPLTSTGEQDVKETTPNNAGPEAEKGVEEAESGQENSEKNEVHETVAKDSQVGADANDMKNQEAIEQTENCPVSREETPHGPNAPPIAC